MEGLDVFLLDNAESFIFAQESLADTFLFVALAFFAPLFRRNPLDRWIRGLLFATSAIGLAGTVGDLIGHDVLARRLLASAAPFLVAVALLVARFGRSSGD